MVYGARLVGMFKKENILSQSSHSCPTTYWDRDKERKHGSGLRAYVKEKVVSIPVPALRSISPVQNFWQSCLRAWLSPERWEVCTCISSGTWRNWAQVSTSWGEDIFHHWTVSTGRREAVPCKSPFQIVSSLSLVFLFHFGAMKAPLCSMELKASKASVRNPVLLLTLCFMLSRYGSCDSYHQTLNTPLVMNMKPVCLTQDIVLMTRLWWVWSSKAESCLV